MDDQQNNVASDPDACSRLREALALAREKVCEAEARFRTVLGQSIDVVYRRDLKADRYDYLSPAVERITGFAVEDFAGLSYAEIVQRIHPDDRPSVVRHMEQCGQGCDGGVFEYRLLCKDGTYRWLSDSGSIVFGPSGEPLYHVGVARDVTERKRLEDELRRHAEGLEKAVAERTARLRRLASEVALAEQRERRRLSDFLHDDLQQILVAAKYGAERLVTGLPEGVASGELGKQLDLVTEAVGRVRDFCGGLTTPLLYVVGLVPALRELAEQMQGRYGLRVVFEVGDMPEIADEAVKVQAFHAVSELLFNAAKHAEVDTVHLRGCSSEGRIEFTVADAGKGFDAGAVMSGGVAGCGCGLFSVGERVGDLGGDLRVESSPGSGTRVTVSMPVPHAPEPARQAGRRAPAGRGRPDGGKVRARVLVADDHDLVRAGVTNLLSRDRRLEVAGEAKNGREAVALARQLRPDIVVMDIRMPEMDGIEATRLIRAEWPDVIVIGVSAFGDEGFKAAMLGAGAAGLLDKADAGVKLRALIAECLAARRKGARTEP